MMSARNFVLIPGAWLGSWVWSKTAPILQEHGYGVYPVTLTGMGERVHLASMEIGIETLVMDVVNVIEFNDLEDVVLVGHSFAGKVAGAVADRIPDRISLMLYLDAFRPEKTRDPQGVMEPAEFGRIEPGQWSLPFSKEIIDMIGNDLKGKNREWMLSKCTPWPLKPAADPITLSDRFDRLRSAYIFCSKGSDAGYIDDITAGKWGKLHGPYRLINTGHWPMVTDPEGLVDSMLSLVRECEI